MYWFNSSNGRGDFDIGILKFENTQIWPAWRRLLQYSIAMHVIMINLKYLMNDGQVHLWWKFFGMGQTWTDDCGFVKKHLWK